jgi:hypothetical protein
MKRVFTSKRFTIDLVKGFVFGIGLSDSNKYLSFLIGPVLFELDIERVKLKNQL